MNTSNFKTGDYVVNEIFSTFMGFPYVMKITKIDNEFNIINFDFKGEEMYISSKDLRYATKFERFFGPIYDFFIK